MTNAYIKDYGGWGLGIPRYDIGESGVSKDLDGLFHKLPRGKMDFGTFNEEDDPGAREFWTRKIMGEMKENQVNMTTQTEIKFTEEEKYKELLKKLTRLEEEQVINRKKAEQSEEGLKSKYNAILQENETQIDKLTRDLKMVKMQLDAKSEVSYDNFSKLDAVTKEKKAIEESFAQYKDETMKKIDEIDKRHQEEIAVLSAGHKEQIDILTNNLKSSTATNEKIAEFVEKMRIMKNNHDREIDRLNAENKGRLDTALSLLKKEHHQKITEIELKYGKQTAQLEKFTNKVSELQAEVVATHLAEVEASSKLGAVQMKNVYLQEEILSYADKLSTALKNNPAGSDYYKQVDDIKSLKKTLQEKENEIALLSAKETTNNTELLKKNLEIDALNSQIKVMKANEEALSEKLKKTILDSGHDSGGLIEKDATQQRQIQGLNLVKLELSETLAMKEKELETYIINSNKIIADKDKALQNVYTEYGNKIIELEKLVGSLKVNLSVADQNLFTELKNKFIEIQGLNTEITTTKAMASAYKNVQDQGLREIQQQAQENALVVQNLTRQQAALYEENAMNRMKQLTIASKLQIAQAENASLVEAGRHLSNFAANVVNLNAGIANEFKAILKRGFDNIQRTTDQSNSVYQQVFTSIMSLSNEVNNAVFPIMNNREQTVIRLYQQQLGNIRNDIITKVRKIAPIDMLPALPPSAIDKMKVNPLQSNQIIIPVDNQDEVIIDLKNEEEIGEITEDIKKKNIEMAEMDKKLKVIEQNIKDRRDKCKDYAKDLVTKCRQSLAIIEPLSENIYKEKDHWFQFSESVLKVLNVLETGYISFMKNWTNFDVIGDPLSSTSILDDLTTKLNTKYTESTILKPFALYLSETMYRGAFHFIIYASQIMVVATATIKKYEEQKHVAYYKNQHAEVNQLLVEIEGQTKKFFNSEAVKAGDYGPVKQLSEEVIASIKDINTQITSLAASSTEISEDVRKKFKELTKNLAKYLPAHTKDSKPIIYYFPQDFVSFFVNPSYTIMSIPFCNALLFFTKILAYWGFSTKLNFQGKGWNLEIDNLIENYRKIEYEFKKECGYLINTLEYDMCEGPEIFYHKLAIYAAYSHLFNMCEGGLTSQSITGECHINFETSFFTFGYQDLQPGHGMNLPPFAGYWRNPQQRVGGYFDISKRNVKLTSIFWGFLELLLNCSIYWGWLSVNGYSIADHKDANSVGNYVGQLFEKKIFHMPQNFIFDLVAPVIGYILNQCGNTSYYELKTTKDMPFKAVPPTLIQNLYTALQTVGCYPKPEDNRGVANHEDVVAESIWTGSFKRTLYKGNKAYIQKEVPTSEEKLKPFLQRLFKTLDNQTYWKTAETGFQYATFKYLVWGNPTHETKNLDFINTISAGVVFQQNCKTQMAIYNDTKDVVSKYIQAASELFKKQGLLSLVVSKPGQNMEGIIPYTNLQFGANLAIGNTANSSILKSAVEEMIKGYKDFIRNRNSLARHNDSMISKAYYAVKDTIQSAMQSVINKTSGIADYLGSLGVKLIGPELSTYTSIAKTWLTGTPSTFIPKPQTTSSTSTPIINVPIPKDIPKMADTSTMKSSSTSSKVFGQLLGPSKKKESFTQQLGPPPIIKSIESRPHIKTTKDVFSEALDTRVRKPEPEEDEKE